MTTKAVLTTAGRPSLTRSTTTKALLFFSLFFLSLILVNADNPKSKPYVAYRTDPFDQPTVATWVMKGGIEKSSTSSSSINGEGIHKNEVNRRNSKKHRGGSDDGGTEDIMRCPLSFRLGSTHASHQLGGSVVSSTSSSSEGGVGPIARSPPVIYPLHPDLDAGSGRQILLATTWEVLEMWTPGGVGGGGGSSSSSSSEQLKEDEQFPLLFEGSSFYHTSPIVYDVAGDGIMDAILGDYDGELHLIGLDFEQDVLDKRGGEGKRQRQPENYRNRRRKRYYERISVPRLAVRKFWFDAAIGKTDIYNNNNATALLSSLGSSSSSDPNRTREDFLDPYHTYFEQSNKDWRRAGEHGEESEHHQPLRGVSADVLTMGMDEAKALADRRRRQGRRILENSHGDDKDVTKVVAAGEEERAENEETRHRRLQEEGLDTIVIGPVDATREQHNEVEQIEDSSQDFIKGEIQNEKMQDEDTIQGYQGDDGLLHDDALEAPPDGTESMEDGDFSRNWGDDIMMENEGEARDSSFAGEMEADEMRYKGMDDYFPYGEHGYVDDGYKPRAPEGWDTYAQYQEAKDAYFHDSNYLYLPPHLLSTCTVVELLREYVSPSMKPADLIDSLILCAVSYYFDEDEERAGRKRSFGTHANANGGDETEEQRGRYVANAILGYNLK